MITNIKIKGTINKFTSCVNCPFSETIDELDHGEITACGYLNCNLLGHDKSKSVVWSGSFYDMDDDEVGISDKCPIIEISTEEES